MTAEAARSKAERRNFCSKPIGALLPAVTRPAFRSQGAATAQLIADWPSIVGPDLAASTVPRRLSAGTLTLGCGGPVALELQHLAGPLMERINGAMGRPAVQRLRFVQEMVRPPARPAPRRPAAQAAPVPVDGMPDGPLRDALSALGQAIRADRA